MHTYWLETENLEELTKETHALALPLPAAIFYPVMLRKEASNLVFASEGRENTQQAKEDIEKRVCPIWALFHCSSDKIVFFLIFNCML